MLDRILLIIMLMVASLSASAQSAKLFTKLTPDQCGVRFKQRSSVIKISVDSMSKINSMVPGCGVAIGDFTGDGRPDLVFSSFAGCGFYRNDGDLRFTDVTDSTGIPNDSLHFSSGLNLIDIDADGDLDLFIARWQNACRLLINDGRGHFTEQAEKYGLNYRDENVHSVFFDYDKDGLLDCYIVTYSNWYAAREVHMRTPDSVIAQRSLERQMAGRVTPHYQAGEKSNFEVEVSLLNSTEERHGGRTDHLFRNMGNGRFEDATYNAWISDRGMGLSATVSDINLDGWPDIYVANDFNSTDLIYMNNGDGTYAEKMKYMTRRASLYSMGSDVADLNGDGLVDIITTDMLPRSHVRRITNGGGSTGDFSIYNPTHDSNQIVRNMVQLNRGLNLFSDIGYMTGMAATDWSWACLMQDYDLDGLTDVFIANGYSADVTNQDSVYNINRSQLEAMAITDALREPNNVFRQTAPLRFSEVGPDWGLNDTSVTFGAAYGDLDNDGDLELVVPNYDSVAYIYRNNAREQGLGGYLALRFHGKDFNPAGLGAKVRVVAGGKSHYRENYPVRGFQSRMDDKMIVGLGNASIVDSVIVEWTDGTSQVLTEQPTNSTIDLFHANAVQDPRKHFVLYRPEETIFRQATDTLGLNFVHYENYFDDFKRYRLMPTRVSWGGPAVAVADVTGDGLEDVVFGHSKGYSTAIYAQTAAGKFAKFDAGMNGVDTTYETQAMLLVDIDGDKDRDLICAGGGAEFATTWKERELCVYINNGKGQMTRTTSTLPSVSTNATTLNACDFDSDGDMDLFIGGGVATDLYPYCERSYLLSNDGKGAFTDVTASVAPGLEFPGIVRAALWSDVDNDDRMDLVVVGEWMPLTIFRNTASGFVNVTSSLGLDSTSGWWFSVTGADVDNDGDIDYICGNLGENSRYHPTKENPLEIFAADFDDNGSVDPLITYWVDGTRYLVRDRVTIFSQMPTLNRRFNNFNDFATTPFANVVDSQLVDTCFHRFAHTLQSTVFLNNGSRGFSAIPLPMEAQISPVMGIETMDLNDDSAIDMVIVGNMYGAESDIIRYDAGKGLVLFGLGDGNFRPVSPVVSGFVSQYDTRGLVSVKRGGSKEDPTVTFVTAVNQGKATTYTIGRGVTKNLKVVSVDPSSSASFMVKLGDKVRKVEPYCGSSYRSQTSCNLVLPNNAVILTGKQSPKSGSKQIRGKKS